IYNTQRLMKIAEQEKFLQNANDESGKIQKELEHIIYLYIYEEVDCFRTKTPRYRTLIDTIIEIYQSRVIETVQGDIPTMLTADQRRKIFFSIFADCYEKNLFNLLLSEGHAFLDIFFNFSEMHMWQYWDLYTKRLIGLSGSSTHSVGAP